MKCLIYFVQKSVQANNLNRDIMRLVKNMPRLELGTRFTLRKDKSQDIRTDQEEQEQDHAYAVSLPHEVFAGIWEKYPNVFKKCYSEKLGTWNVEELRT